MVERIFLRAYRGSFREQHPVAGIVPLILPKSSLARTTPSEKCRSKRQLARKPAYEPCVFDCRIMMPAGIERVHEQVPRIRVGRSAAELHRVRRGHGLGENILDDRPELQFEPTPRLMIEGLYR